MIISTKELSTILKLKGIKDTGYSEDELETLIKYKTSELQGLIGVNIEEKQESQTIRYFNDDRIRLLYYPVQGIESITLKNEEMDCSHYTLDHNLGLVYFDKIYNGMITVNYISSMSEDEINNVVSPLLVDMILYDILNKGKDPNNGIVSSVKEGDVSVNYDTSSTLGNRIWARVDELRNRYARTARVVMI